MTLIDQIMQGYRIDLSQVKKLPASAISEGTAAEKAAFQAQMQKMREAEYTRPVNLDGHGSQDIYAEVKVGGRTIATLYNDGTMMTSNADHGKVMRALKDDTQLSGPAGAQERAEKIAKALGGTMVKRQDALTPAQYRALPPIRFEVDYAAMEADAKAQSASAEARAGTAATLVQTQVIAQQEAEEVALTEDSAGDEAQNAVEEFLRFAAMTPEEKMRYLILQSMGMTEEELQQMSPEARAEVEEEIAMRMKEKMKEKIDAA